MYRKIINIDCKKIILCIVIPMLSPLWLIGQSASVKQHETCMGGDGIIKVTLPEETGYSASIEPHSYGTQNGKIITYTGLSAGTYKIKITSVICPDKPFLNTSLKINKEKQCTFPVNISIVSKWTCANPETVLKASASGGTSPHSYSWANGTTSTSQTGKVTVSVSSTDSKGKTGFGKKTFYVADVQCSVDPNEISGPIGYAEKQMVAKKDKMEYTILYENDPEFATAPASRVKIVYPVGDKQNINSFRIGDFGFGDFVFTVPQNSTSYYKRIDMSSSLNVWVDVTAGIDLVKKELFWIFQSIDPQTGIEPVSAQMGYLPINNKETGSGEGYVNFNILPANDVQTGDEILADASIIFDDNAPIATNVWSNVIDALSPKSSLSGNIIDDSTVSISFSGEDDELGSGIKSYGLYVSVNEEPFGLYGYYQPDSICLFMIEENTKYKFFSIVEDNVGNLEALKTIAEFEIGDLTYQIFAESNLVDAGTVQGSGEYRHGQSVTIKATPNSDYIFSSWTVNNETVSTDSIMNFTANDSKVFVANFMPKYQLNIQSNPIDAGTYTGDSIYVYGDVAIIKAIPNAGYRFINWTRSSEVVSNANEYNFTMYGNTEFIANFESIAPFVEEKFAKICFGEKYNFHGKELNTSGVYRDTLQNSMGLDSIVVLNLTILPEVIINLGEDLIINDYQSVPLDAGTGFVAYRWSTGETTQTILLENEEKVDNISVWVEVSTTDNCIGSDTIQITYNKPNSIINVEGQSDNVKIFPNPTKGKLNVLFDYDAHRNIRLYDLIGKLLYYSEHDEKLIELDFEKFPVGTYIMKIDNSKDIKIIISR